MHVNILGTGNAGLQIDPDQHVVASIDSEGLAFLSGRIDIGFVLTAIANGPVNEETQKLLSGSIVLGSALKLSFKRPVPPLPLHGIARSGIHKRLKHVMHREQVGWLNANVFADGLVLMRDKPAAVAMKAHFRRRMRDDTLTPMWLDQYKIASWLCDRKKDEKYRQKVAKKERKAKATVHGLAQLKLKGSKKRS